MRTLLIIFLSVALLVAAFATRPGKRELALYLLDSNGAKSEWSRSDFARAEEMTHKTNFHDYLLWVDVEKEGKVVYTGAFAHWFPRGKQAEKAVPEIGQIAKLFQAVGK